MKHETQDLENKTVWLLGTKLKSEETFFVQLITDYKRYSSIFTKLHNQKKQPVLLPDKNGDLLPTEEFYEIDFFITEIEVPYKLKPETAPF